MDLYIAQKSIITNTFGAPACPVGVSFGVVSRLGPLLSPP